MQPSTRLQRQDTIETYEAYLERFSKGAHSTSAKARVAEILDAERWMQLALAGAFEAAADIDGAEDKARALGYIASAQAEAGDTRDAGATFVEALETAERIDGFFKAPALEDIASAQAEAGDIAGAFETARRINSDWRGLYKARALSDIAIAQAEAGDTRGAGATFYEALETARQIDNTRALSDLAIAQAKAGDLAGAFETAWRIDDLPIHADPEPDDDHKASAFWGIANAQAEAGDLAGALWTARRIDNADLKAGALENIARAQAEAGDIAGALDTAERIPRSRYKPEALGAIAFEQAEGGAHREAYSRFQDALKAASELEQAFERTMGYKRLADALTGSG